MTTLDPLAVLADLDALRNMLGPLGPDPRAHIWAALDRPGRDTWLAARSVVVGPGPTHTLWQAVVAAGAGSHPAAVAYLSRSETVPTVALIAQALSAAARATRDTP